MLWLKIIFNRQEDSILEIQEMLGAAAFAKAWEKGQDMDFPAAVALTKKVLGLDPD